MKLILWNIAFGAVELYCVLVLLYQMRVASDLQRKLLVLSLIILQALEVARTLYDMDGPGDHFPLEIGLPLLALQAIITTIATTKRYTRAH